MLREFPKKIKIRTSINRIASFLQKNLTFSNHGASSQDCAPQFDSKSDRRCSQSRHATVGSGRKVQSPTLDRQPHQFPLQANWQRWSASTPWTKTCHNYSIPKEVCEKYALSMRKRLEECLDKKGGSTIIKKSQYDSNLSIIPPNTTKLWKDLLYNFVVYLSY